MAEKNLPALGLRAEETGDFGLDPFADPAWFRGILWRRVLAFLLDSLIVYSLCFVAAFVLALMNVITLGITAVPVLGLAAVVPVIYFAAFTGGPRSATPGMRALGLELRTQFGARPGYPQATLRVVLYYATLAFLSPLVLVIVFFNRRRRALHDILSGTVVVTHMGVAGA